MKNIKLNETINDNYICSTTFSANKENIILLGF